ncbi:Protein transport protein Sec61 subunit beta [Clydaea vesicula]|uniref:Protein transport protein Sec61 subunit beta n=1 Tax=Clydaea vesicula TaxID=447962 RepID=A0AAD5U704_9FUNG|nr:Protein transport protein Sec61 subunit beta [Clydaea vesicula]KAJ3389109.1 Protein transport protein Sec61 subunit beta [Lobulomyces angularis]
MNTASSLRKRNAKSSESAKNANKNGSSATMMKMYSQDDTPGIQVDPVSVLVGSLTFIASVFILHIVGKYTKA